MRFELIAWSFFRELTALDGSKIGSRPSRKEGKVINKSLLINWLLQDVAEHAANYYTNLEELSIPRNNLNECLFQLNNRRSITLPSLPSAPDDMISILRIHFHDRVTFISLVLNHYFPEVYFFYRVSRLEREIFDGLDFFSEVVPEFRLPFASVGQRGFDRYLKLNESLLAFVHRHWRRLGNLETKKRLAYLYKLLGELFLEKGDYNRYWVMATSEVNFPRLAKKTVVWSGRKEMQPGDLVFIYRMSPRKAVTDIFRVKDHPVFDPWGAWDGFWVHLERLCSLDDITFDEMRRDPVLGSWGAVRKRFQGTVTEPVPHSIYNRLLDKIPSPIRRRFGLTKEPVAPVGRSGEFSSEADFEDRVIEPLIRRWGFKYQRQHPCLFSIGSQRHHTRVDFLVSDGQGPLTLFEDKFRILRAGDLGAAVDQAKSYALQLGLPSFVVASPEHLRLYSLNRSQEHLKVEISSDGLTNQSQEEQFRSMVLKLK